LSPQTLSATVPCKTCSKDVSRTAPHCPHCGEAMPGLAIRCPKCRSNRVGLERQGFSLGNAAAGCALLGPLGLMGGMVGRNSDTLRCHGCGNTWAPTLGEWFAPEGAGGTEPVGSASLARSNLLVVPAATSSDHSSLALVCNRCGAECPEVTVNGQTVAAWDLARTKLSDGKADASQVIFYQDLASMSFTIALHWNRVVANLASLENLPKDADTALFRRLCEQMVAEGNPFCACPRCADGQVVMRLTDPVDAVTNEFAKLLTGVGLLVLFGIVMGMVMGK
jgi:hypothetical protein